MQIKDIINIKLILLKKKHYLNTFNENNVALMELSKINRVRLYAI